MRSRVGDERRQHVEQRRLAGAGAAADQDVQLRVHAVAQELEHVRRERLEADEVLGLQAIGRESANREQGTVDGERRNDGVDARAVGQARVDHRRAVVDAAADAAHDAVDDAHQVLVVLERRRHRFELAAALDEHLLVGVDQDVADRLVAQQRLERAEAEHLVEHVAENGVALARPRAECRFRRSASRRARGSRLRPCLRSDVASFSRLRRVSSLRCTAPRTSRYCARRASLAAERGAAGAWVWER